jgi:hypothetical protein
MSHARQTLSHADPLVQQAKVRWLVHPPVRNPAITFNLLYSLFLKGATYGGIAQKVKLSSARVAQLYNTHFRELFGNKTGSTRFQEIREAKRLVTMQKREERFLRKNQLAAEIVACVTPLGYAVRAVTRGKYDDAIHSRRLLINGMRCGLYEIGSTFQARGGKRLYASTQVQKTSLSEVEIFIFCIRIPQAETHFYVIPSRVLAEKSNAREVHLYFPAEMYPPSNRAHPHIKYEKYRGAWHLLSRS